MGLWSLFVAASMPVLEVLIISVIGAFLATRYCNVLTADARKYINKVVFIVFTPSLMFASLAEAVTLEDIISWWFMPINIVIIFLIGGTIGWIVVKILKPERYLEGLIIAMCSAGNWGSLLLIIIPAACDEDGSPFGESSICSVRGLSYGSFSMALGSFLIWTHSYHLIKTDAAARRKELRYIIPDSISKIPNNNFDVDSETCLLKNKDQVPPNDQVALLVPSTKATGEEAIVKRSSSGKLSSKMVEAWRQVQETLHRIIDTILEAPNIAAIVGFVFGATPWLKSLIIGDGAPLRVIQNSITLLGNGTIPCLTLILGGNLTQGIRTARLRPLLIIAVIFVRFFILPIAGLGVVKAAGELGFLPQDPLYRYVLMIQFTVPPAMNIGTMTQLFEVGEEECSVLFLSTYLVAAFALTIWSTVYLWMLA